MTKLLSGVRKEESGMALVMVLILLLVGSLIIAPLVLYMSTGLKSSQIHEQLMERFYAADAGIESGLRQIMWDGSPEGGPSVELPQNVGDNHTYNIEELTGAGQDVNDKDVQVEIVLEEDMQGFLTVLLDSKHKLTVSPSGHGEWAVITHSAGAGEYTITMTYNGAAENKRIEGVGAWLQGDYACTDNSSGDDDMTDNYANCTFKLLEAFRAGTAFIWEWPPGSLPTFQPGDNMSQSFKFTPEQVPSFYFSWVSVQSWDYRVVTSGETFEVWKVTSTATDNTSDKQTQVVAYMARQGDVPPFPVKILTWETSP